MSSTHIAMLYFGVDVYEEGVPCDKFTDYKENTPEPERVDFETWAKIMAPGLKIDIHGWGDDPCWFLYTQKFDAFAYSPETIKELPEVPPEEVEKLKKACKDMGIDPKGIGWHLAVYYDCQ